MILHEAHTFVDQASSQQASAATSIETRNEVQISFSLFFSKSRLLGFLFFVIMFMMHY
jgi:hypothetical protein